MLAAYHGHAAVVERWRSGAPTSTPSTTAASRRWPGRSSRASSEVVEVLLRHGADPDAGSPTARETSQMLGGSL